MRDSSEPTWETLPPPSPVPLKKVLAYDSPGKDSSDPVDLPLTAALGWWMLASVFSAWAVGFIVFLVVVHAPPIVFALPTAFLFGVGVGWYRLLFPRRLHLDAEGLSLSGVGHEPDVISIPWAEIDSLRLVERRLWQGAEELHLIAHPVPGTSLSDEVHTDIIDMSLGATDSRAVDAALCAHSPRKYWAATSDSSQAGRRTRRP